MTNIFLAPRSNETSHKNFQSSIIVGRSYKVLEPFLNEDEKRILSKYLKVQIRIWGNKESLKSRWEKMREGDYVLFCAKGTFYYSARVVLTKHSEELAKEIWEVDENGKPWSCIFFVDNLKEIEIPLKVVQELAEYRSTWDRVQGFMPLNERGTAAIKAKFGSIEAFLNQKPEIYKVIESVIERNEEEVLVAKKVKFVDKVALLERAMRFQNTKSSHIIATTPHKVRVESRAQKKLVAEIEDNSCQVCGWALEWVNSKKEKIFRIDIDHIIDKADGGSEEIGNLWVLCPNCHAKKTLGVITIDPIKKKICENGIEINLHHDSHLRWNKN